MTITISISTQAEALLRERAAAQGEEIGRVAAQLLERAVSGDGKNGHGQLTGERGERVAAWNSFVAGMQEWGKTLPAGHVVDDSRASIYAGRGE
jgi:hypothetical protein